MLPHQRWPRTVRGRTQGTQRTQSNRSVTLRFSAFLADSALQEDFLHDRRIARPALEQVVARIFPILGNWREPARLRAAREAEPAVLELRSQPESRSELREAALVC